MFAWMRLCFSFFVIGIAGCAAVSDAKSPDVRLADLKLLSSGLFEQRFQLDLRVSNPNDFALRLDGLTFNLDLNDASFATGQSDQNVTVPSLGETLVSVQASTTFLDVAQQVLALTEGGNVKYRLSGIAFLRGLGRNEVPYEKEGSLRLFDALGGGRTLVPR